MRLHLATLAILSALAADAQALPKYGPQAQPLSSRTNIEYFQKNAAADYWALSPYYIGQETPRGCSAANMAMLLNAARIGADLDSHAELITFQSLLDKYAEKKYSAAIRGKTVTTGTLFSNKNLSDVLREAARKIEIKGGNPRVEFTPVDQKALAAEKQRFVNDLAENEKSADDFIFFSFRQDKVTDDPEGGPHVATVGAYDAKKQLVLVMDPDRKFYEPYWTTVDKLFAAISDPESDSRREAGWIRFKVR